MSPAEDDSFGERASEEDQKRVGGTWGQWGCAARETQWAGNTMGGKPTGRETKWARGLAFRAIARPPAHHLGDCVSTRLVGGEGPQLGERRIRPITARRAAGSRVLRRRVEAHGSGGSAARWRRPQARCGRRGEVMRRECQDRARGKSTNRSHHSSSSMAQPESKRAAEG